MDRPSGGQTKYDSKQAQRSPAAPLGRVVVDDGVEFEVVWTGAHGALPGFRDSVLTRPERV